jgi:hypothetical protein
VILWKPLGSYAGHRAGGEIADIEVTQTPWRERESVGDHDPGAGLLHS